MRRLLSVKVQNTIFIASMLVLILTVDKHVNIDLPQSYYAYILYSTNTTNRTCNHDWKDLF